MKLIIDIDEEDFNLIRDNIKSYSLADVLFGAVKDGEPYEERPQGDLISREALKKAIAEYCKNYQGFDGIVDIIDNAPAVETMNPDYQIKVNIPEEETQKLIEELQRCRPCILPEFEFTDDDIQELIKDNFNIGYEMAKNKYARPQGEWFVFGEYKDKTVLKCQCCKSTIVVPDDYRPKFCEYCGAEMRKGGVENDT